MKINKSNPTEDIQLSIDINECKNQSVVIVDDVLNSGKTLTYALKHFLVIEIKSIKTAVLVNRSHKKFPISADFKGINLSSSLQNHVDVVFIAKDKIEAFFILMFLLSVYYRSIDLSSQFIIFLPLSNTLSNKCLETNSSKFSSDLKFEIKGLFFYCK